MLCSYIEDHAIECDKNNPANLDNGKLGELKRDLHDLQSWPREGSEYCPMQLNSVDCGVFVCMYALHAACDMELRFTQRDMPAVRRYIASSILVANKSLDAHAL